MAATIEGELGIKAKLIAGANGIFDVEADGEMIYSKFETGFFPEHDEVIAALKKRG